MKANKKKNKENVSYGRLEEISLVEIKKKYPDKLIDAYVEDERLVVVLDTCRLKFDERIPQKTGSVYGSLRNK
tara:strand:+ start:219 stop:437 length:219 start_codon:yes stop_codon:yes gene_type:complete